MTAAAVREFQGVRPHARAGVEISLRPPIAGAMWFALMRGRELKSTSARYTARRWGFALMRGRELKWQHRAPSKASWQVRPHARAGVEISGEQRA